jgi:excinuclease ABC subunit C
LNTASKETRFKRFRVQCRQDDGVPSGMKNNTENKYSLAEQRLYPYLKITNEKFPRLLVTRKIENDNAEYFGAFLPETGVRFFLDFLNKIFRLRTCTIDVDGKFSVPCPQFYAKRCVAPCVESLCDEKEYAETVELARLFLRRDNAKLKEIFLRKIETRAEWRDKFLEIENFREKNEWILWLDDAADNWEIERKDNRIFLFLVTTRGRKTLGKRVFVFEENAGNITPAEILEQILPQFYRFHAPAEIRVFTDFPGRKSLAENLSKRENRKIKITAASEKNQKKTIERANRRNKFEFDFKNIKPPASAGEIQIETKRIFNLKRAPKRFEAFDAAHISGTNPVAANVVWENGKFLADEYEFWLLDETSELKTLAKSIVSRFSGNKKLPDLLLIDGGVSQLNAVLKALENFENRKFFIVSAVKPPRKHGEISYFLTETGDKILFEPENEAFQFLRQLRDEAHNLANSVHRARRDFSHFYELAAVLPNSDEKTRRELLQKFGSINNLKTISYQNLKADFDAQTAEIVWKDLQNYKSNGERKIEPLIVPLRYDDPNGDANNLQPLQTFR